MSLRMSSVVALMLGAGCVATVDEAQNEASTGSVTQTIETCPVYECGNNSPQIAQFGFWDLKLPTTIGAWSQPNSAGFAIAGFVKDNLVYLPQVYAGKLSATRTSSPNTTVTLTGTNLVNGYFLIRNGAQLYALRVTEVLEVESWAKPSSGKVMLESYKLDWAEFINGSFVRYQNMCKTPPKSGKDGDTTLGMTGKLAYHTLLFEGDRIEQDTKHDTGIDNAWINLGCAGSALAKLALTGHTEAAHHAGTFETTMSERTTMLKMLAGDYCGDGFPFTVAGQPLNWIDDKGTMKLLTAKDKLVFEARWDENGATCLNKPRVDVHPTTLSLQVFASDEYANVYQQILAHCPAKMLPACSDMGYDSHGSHLISATP